MDVVLEELNHCITEGTSEVQEASLEGHWGRGEGKGQKRDKKRTRGTQSKGQKGHTSIDVSLSLVI